MNKSKIYQNESGLASLVIAIVIVIVLSTIVLGFMQITRREQRRTLDRQLSQQAYYAAESGINDATNAIDKQAFTANKTNCGPTGVGFSFSGAASNKLTADGNVQYTCLLINQTPPSIIKTLDTNVSQTFPVNAGPGGVNAITFSWVDAAQTPPSTLARPTSSSVFPPAGTSAGTGATNWDSIGLIRLDLVSTTVLNQSAMENSMRSVFLYPNLGGTGVATAPVSGDIVSAKCVAGTCTATITGLSGNYYARTIAYYSKVTVTVTASVGGVAVPGLIGGQIVIDSTGKAADVTRRIQERISPSASLTADFALASMESLCKTFYVKPGDVVIDKSATGDPACSFSP